MVKDKLKSKHMQHCQMQDYFLYTSFWLQVAASLFYYHMTDINAVFLLVDVIIHMID